MAIKFNRSQTFATNGTVTAAGLHNLVDGLDIYQSLITDQTNLTSVGTADELLIADADLSAGDAPRAVTVQELFDDALTVGTYTNAQLTGNLTYGTATGNRTVSTTASITTGTINNATLGTTTGTAATFTTGTIPTGTFGTTTSTAATITTGTIPTLTVGTSTSTAGTVTTFNSTTGTITNLTTTLAGDFTISAGTGTLGTTGVTAGTYGTSTEAVTLTIDAKGRVTTVSTSAISTTPAAGSITFPMLSTSGTESDNVAKRTAKAWVNFDGTTNVGGNCTISDDFNVSSVADNGTGLYTVNFSSALPNANYSVCFGAKNTNLRGGTLLIDPSAGSQGTSSIKIQNREYNGTNFVNIDESIITVTIFSS